jgi:fumarylacetoacetate (FAA) hydrolase family protein
MFDGIRGMAVDPLPTDGEAAVLIGRVWNPAVGGPCVVALRAGDVVDITAEAATVRDLCENADPAGLASSADGPSLGRLTDVLANTPRQSRDPSRHGCSHRLTCRRSRQPA